MVRLPASRGPYKGAPHAKRPREFGPADAQVIGSHDNFDCFNDTGDTAEGFEVDVENVSPSDLTREFPSNFSSTPWLGHPVRASDGHV
jgi:hypothetical protein